MQAILYMQQGQTAEAEAAFLKAIEIDPDYLANYSDLAQLYIAQNNLEAAEKQINAGLSKNAGNFDLKLAQAHLYEAQQNREKEMEVLRDILEKDPRNQQAFYQLSLIQPDAGIPAAQKKVWQQLAAWNPSNIVPHLQLATLYAAESNTDSALFQMENVKRLSPAFSDAAAKFYEQAIQQLHAGHSEPALAPIKQFQQLMTATAAYAEGVKAIHWPEPAAGYPTFTTSLYSQQALTGQRPSVTLADMQFAEASELVGLPNNKDQHSTSSVIALNDDITVGDMYIYYSFLPAGKSQSEIHLYVSQGAMFQESQSRRQVLHDGVDKDAGFMDYDNDGFQDLFVLTSQGLLIYNNQGNERFELVSNDGLTNIRNGEKLLFVDPDQDGDLDILVVCQGPNRLLRNNGDGSFTDATPGSELGGTGNRGVGAAYADWDLDGDIDIFELDAANGLSLYDNNRHSRFTNITDSVDLGQPPLRGSSLALGDYNNDGLFDLFVGPGDNGQCYLMRNTGRRFEADTAVSRLLTRSLQGIAIHDAAFWDFDNDGRVDLLVAGQAGNGHGVKLFHNDSSGVFRDVSDLLPPTIDAGQHIAITDFNLDGDEDIFLTAPSGIFLLRNDGGNKNQFVQIQMLGVSYGSSKNNRLGIGARVELKSGNLYQVKMVTRPMMNFGLGAHDSLDAVRIIWPNGLPQYIADPSKRERVVEELKLKGSCPFLFTWNGERFEFNKDMLWRSALGMPLAIHGQDTSFAFSDASKEFLLIPGEKLKPRNGLYSIRITEELWEAVFFDKASLYAIDHPDSQQVFVDERFVLPPFPGLTVYSVNHERLPVSVTDGMGNDQRPKIAAYDYDYISNFSLSKYQGLAEDHDLVLDLGASAVKQDSLLLFLRGWVFPPDASINTALTQTEAYRLKPPSLQVINARGEWETVIDNMGYPMGKDKMVIVNLSHKFLSPTDRRVRIRTNMQIYWDHIFFSTAANPSVNNIRALPMHSAALQFRGYSATFRKGGPFGPHWFAYDQATGGQQWRDLTGYYTRYGDVLPLLRDADDEYIIANSGDEIRIVFDGRNLPPLKQGWTRDFLIYSEGWVKDGDLNTAFGQTVEPLPFHAMPSYPYYAPTRYPDSRRLQEYRKKYNTRRVDTRAFVERLRK